MLFGIAAAPVAGHLQARTARRPAAILTVISGDVLVRDAGGDFSAAIDGAVLYAGTMLRTSADARALLTLFEGTTVELDPSSDVTIEDATAGTGSTIAQALGRSWHVVMHLTIADSRYEPTTPAATASVRGGEFDVSPAAALTDTTLTTPEYRVVTAVAGSTSATVVAPAQTTTTTVRTNAALAPARSAVGAERTRRVTAQTLASRAVPVARSRDRAHQSDRGDD
jgi:hypothetical protein